MRENRCKSPGQLLLYQLEMVTTNSFAIIKEQFEFWLNCAYIFVTVLQKWKTRMFAKRFVPTLFKNVELCTYNFCAKRFAPTLNPSAFNCWFCHVSSLIAMLINISWHILTFKTNCLKFAVACHEKFFILRIAFILLLLKKGTVNSTFWYNQLIYINNNKCNQ